MISSSWPFTLLNQARLTANHGVVIDWIVSSIIDDPSAPPDGFTFSQTDGRGVMPLDDAAPVSRGVGRHDNGRDDTTVVG